ncbi:MAG: M23 family metallopeptidase [Bacteroidales bacterium]|nr:M23 family metallopeptidase [Bacteroidales bacterium]
MAFKKIKQFSKGVTKWLRLLFSTKPGDGTSHKGNSPFMRKMHILYAKMKRKQRLVVMDAENYREHWSFRLSALNLFVGVGIVGIVLMIITFLLIAFTPLHNMIPGYTNSEMVDQTYRNVLLLDSLNMKVQHQEEMMAVLGSIVAGEEIADTSESESRPKAQGTEDQRCKADSLLREEMAKGNKTSNEQQTTGTGQQTASGGQLFFPPIKGKIIAAYNSKEGRIGVDIAGNINDIIKSAANGTVFFAGFTADDGYVIAVQHPGNIITVYKHNSALLKHNGDMVRAGEPIAYLGHSAGSTTPHLYFELWINGKTVDPLSYVSF